VTAGLGARLTPGGVRFDVWAPAAREVTLALEEPITGRRPLRPDPDGYHRATFGDLGPGQRYRLSLDDGPLRADPASRYQPEGVDGPSEVFDPAAMDWHDAGWQGRPLEEMVLSEVHIGTFTAAGTFDAAIASTDRLAEIGITAIELMPVGQFAVRRNWGYDGVLPFAVQDSYGGPHGLQLFVDACHSRGLAVLMDVVYNHLGPYGNHLADFGPYFTATYSTPWGPALNFDEASSDEVRRYFIENAVQWIRDFHVDGLRLDAVHAIVDPTARPFVEQLTAEVHGTAAELRRTVLVIAESSANDPRLVRGDKRGGWGLDAQWNDDFHHALRVALTGRSDGYYEDYQGVDDLATVLRRRWLFDGRYSTYRGRTHGRPALDIDHQRLVVFAQNHDHIGNRPGGERLDAEVDREQRKLATAAVLLSPFTPLLFMGEEYGEPAPFPYFVDHPDPDLLEAVRRGRAEEFARFDWTSPLDPDDPATARAAVLHPELAGSGWHATLQDLSRHLLAVRRGVPAVSAAGVEVAAEVVRGTLHVVHTVATQELRVWHRFAGDPDVVELDRRGGKVVVDTADRRWAGPGGARTGLTLDPSTAELALSGWSTVAAVCQRS
jgi:maltooligosyltrehalose trehalohydrolase